MKTVANLLQCRRCGASPPTSAPDSTACDACARLLKPIDGVVDALGTEGLSGVGPVVSAFYDRLPFPGYGADDDATTLVDRADATPYARALDSAIAPEAAVLDLGAGTSQTAAYLALRGARRVVVACDASRGALREAAAFRARAKIDNLALVRADLFSAPFRPRAFDVVVCRGVVHHTADPSKAIGVAASYVADGGLLVLGWYDRFGRAAHRLRTAIARVAGRPIDALDPILKNAALAPEKREAWIADQYEHPVEARFGLGFVLLSLRSSGLRYVRTIPPEGPLDRRGDAPTARSRAALALRLLARGFRDADAGLIVAVFERPRRSGGVTP